MLENMYHVTFPDAPLYLVSSWHKGNVKGHSVAKQHFFLCCYCTHLNNEMHLYMGLY